MELRSEMEEKSYASEDSGWLAMMELKRELKENEWEKGICKLGRWVGQW